MPISHLSALSSDVCTVVMPSTISRMAHGRNAHDAEDELVAPQLNQLLCTQRGKGRKRGLAELDGCASNADVIAKCFALYEENRYLQRAYRTLMLKTLMLANNDDPLARLTLIEGQSEPGETFHIPPSSHDDAHGSEPCISICTRRRVVIALELAIPTMRPNYTVPAVVTRRWQSIEGPSQGSGQATRPVPVAAPLSSSGPCPVLGSASSSRARAEEVTINREADEDHEADEADEAEEGEILDADLGLAPGWRRELVTKVLAPQSTELGTLRPVNASILDPTNGVTFQIGIQVVETGEMWSADAFPGKELHQEFLVWIDADRTRDHFHIAPGSSEARLIFHFPHKSTGPGGGRRYRLIIHPCLL